MARIALRNLTRRFGEHAAVNDVSLAIDSAEFVAVLGPSGCGKTTLLRLLAGFERADAGEIWFEDDLQAGEGVHVVPERRGIGMVFQSYALWPHMSVAGNVGYPLRVQGVRKETADELIGAALAQVGMREYAERRPAELSGGQRQRVALARCLVMSPRIVLFDEPLANLDVHLRESMQAQFRRFHRDTSATMVYVTHDQAEAMALADRIVVMHDGVVQQAAAPQTLYAEPATPMVAGFIGRGMVVPVSVLEMQDHDSCRVDIFGAHVVVRARDMAKGAAEACVRPEGLTLRPRGSDAFAATVTDVVFRGAVSSLTVEPAAVADIRLELDVRHAPPELGAQVHVGVSDGWCLPQLSV